jgi:DNA (cytosine-5)-methyltransferase 1
LDTFVGTPDCNQGGTVVVESAGFSDALGEKAQGGMGYVEEKTPTLRAEMHGNIPCVIEAGGFCPEQSAKTRGIGWEEEMGPILRAGVTPAVVAGLEPTVCYAQQAIAEYKQSDVASNQTARQYKSETDLVCCVDCRNLTETPELFQTLQAKPNGGQSLNYSGAVRDCYIVRRLTPTECARLQGFADRWGDIDEKSDFTEEEYRFWLNVRNTHAAINGKQVKEYTKPQMVKWYNGLHTDSAEYKMWGNGIALPCAVDVLGRIARQSRKPKEGMQCTQ